MIVRERASRISILFAALTTSVAVWLFCFSLMYASTNERTAAFWARAAFVAIPFIPTAVYHFVVGLARLERKLHTPVRIAWLLSAFFSLLILTTDQIVDGVEKYTWGYYPRYAWASGPYLLFFFVVLGAALQHGIEAYRHAETDVERRRMGWVSMSLAIGYIACFDYLPSFGVAVLPVGFLSIVGFVLAMGHTVWRYELAEITASLAAPRIVETTRGKILVTDLRRRIRLTTDAVCDMLGYAEEELIGKPVSAVCEELGRDPVESFKNREVVWFTRTGEPVDVSVSAATVLDRRGRTVGMIFNAEDISRRKHEEALRASESRYRTLVESMNEGVMVVNKDETIQFVNQKMADLLGYLPAELAGKPARSFVDESTRTREPQTSRHRLQLRTLRGRDVWVEVSEAPLIDGKGNVAGSIRVHTDVTNQRRAELALRESEARYRLLAEHATDMISRHTPDGRFLYASPASQSLLGYGPEELIGTRPAELIHPEDLPIIEDFRNKLFTRAGTGAITYRMRRKDGSYVWVETTWRAIREKSDDAVTEMVAVARNITERRQDDGMTG